MKLVKHDLEFILQQILLSEAHSNGADPLALLNGNPLLPYGLRTVGGTYNNLVPGQEQFGAADRDMPNALPQVWRPAQGAAFDPDGPGPLRQAARRATPRPPVWSSMARFAPSAT